MSYHSGGWFEWSSGVSRVLETNHLFADTHADRPRRSHLYRFIQLAISSHHKNFL